jgi:hypothetical protein
VGNRTGRVVLETDDLSEMFVTSEATSGLGMHDEVLGGTKGIDQEAEPFEIVVTVGGGFRPFPSFATFPSAMTFELSLAETRFPDSRVRGSSKDGTGDLFKTRGARIL